jgi:hypothetical protein
VTWSLTRPWPKSWPSDGTVEAVVVDTVITDADGDVEEVVVVETVTEEEA